MGTVPLFEIWRMLLAGKGRRRLRSGRLLGRVPLRSRNDRVGRVEQPRAPRKLPAIEKGLAAVLRDTADGVACAGSRKGDRRPRGITSELARRTSQRLVGREAEFQPIRLSATARSSHPSVVFRLHTSVNTHTNSRKYSGALPRPTKIRADSRPVGVSSYQ